MAVRFFLQNAAGAFTPTIRGAWNNVTQTAVSAMATTKLGSSTSVIQAVGSLALPWDVLLRRFMSPPMLSGGTLGGTLQWIIGVLQSNLALDAYFKVHFYVCVGSTDVVRGTLGTFSFGPSTANGNIVGTEWTATTVGRGEGIQTLTDVTCLTGDRIVAELGFRADGAGATTQQGSSRYGGTGIDLTQGSTVLAEAGWFEFSDADSLFGTAPLTPPGAFFPFFP